MRIYLKVLRCKEVALRFESRLDYCTSYGDNSKYSSNRSLENKKIAVKKRLIMISLISFQLERVSLHVLDFEINVVVVRKIEQ